MTGGPDLRAQVGQALDRAEAILTAPGPPGTREALAGARRDLALARDRWQSRTRLALAGRVSSGKSTLVNALLGEHLAATATRELTSVVTWLQHAPRPELTIRYADASRPARPVEPPTIEALAALTTHQAGPPPLGDDVDYVSYRYPNDRLLEFDLIDTPGLDSVLAGDTESTLRHLGPRVDTADALVLVFTRGAHTEDARLVSHFQRIDAAGTTEVSPLTTVGVLTKVELDWTAGQPLLAGGRLAVLEQGRETARRLMDNAGLKHLIYELRPVASQIGAAAGTFTPADLADLTALARLAPSDLAMLAGNTGRLARAQIPAVPAARRCALHDQFTGCGMALACQLIRDGATEAELREQLRELSGLAGLRDLLISHFGRRADLIRLARLIERTRSLTAAHSGLLTARPYDALARASEMITGLELTVAAFGERIVLRAHYAGRLQLGRAGTEEMLRVFGESPDTDRVDERLGLPGAPGDRLARRARERSMHWRGQADRGAGSADTRHACRVLSLSYGHLRELAEAQAG